MSLHDYGEQVSLVHDSLRTATSALDAIFELKKIANAHEGYSPEQLAARRAHLELTCRLLEQSTITAVNTAFSHWQDFLREQR